ncbi:unnamed protein product, partial [Heterosigma akashiwo]
AERRGREQEAKKHREQREGRLAADVAVQSLRAQLEDERDKHKKKTEELQKSNEQALSKMTEDGKKLLASVRAGRGGGGG